MPEQRTPSQQPKGNPVILVEKELVAPPQQQDQDAPIIQSNIEHYSANIVWLDDTGKIIQTDSLSSGEVDKTQYLTARSAEKEGLFAQAEPTLEQMIGYSRQKHSDASAINEIIATELFGDLTDTEFLKYYREHKSTGAALQQKQQGISYQENPNSQEEETAEKTQATPFYDSNENLFSHVKTFLTENLSDETLALDISKIEYDQIRDVFPANLPTIVIKKHGKHTIPAFKQEAEELASIVAHEMIASVKPDYVNFEKAEFNALFEDTATADKLFDEVADNIAYDEINRSQTHTNTSRALLQQQYKLADNLLEHELSLRALKSLHFAQDGQFVMQPAFSDAGQERQAHNLSEHATSDLIKSLPHMLISTTSLSLGQPAHHMFQDTERLLSVYQTAVSDKLLDMDDTLQVNERAQLENFASYLRKAHDRTMDLLGENEKTPANFDATVIADTYLPPEINEVKDASFLQNIISVPLNDDTHADIENRESVQSKEIVHVPDKISTKIVTSRGAYTNYILDGVDPDKAQPVIMTGNPQLNAIFWNDAKNFIDQKISGQSPEKVADTLNEISDALQQYRAESMFTGQYYNAQVALLRVADAHQIGVEKIDNASQGLQFTADYFMLPSKADATLMEQLKDPEAMPAERLENVIAYNLIDVADNYKGGLKQPERTSVSFKDNQRSRTGELLKDRLSALNAIVDEITTARDDIDKNDLLKSAVEKAAKREVNAIENDGRGDQVKKMDERKDASLIRDLLYQADIDISTQRGRGAA